MKVIFALMMLVPFLAHGLPNPNPSRTGDIIPILQSFNEGQHSYAYFYQLGTFFVIDPSQPFQFTNSLQSGGYTLQSDLSTINVPQSGFYLVTVTAQASTLVNANTISVGLVDTTSNTLLISTGVSSFLGSNASIGHVITRTSIVFLNASTNYQMQNTSANPMGMDQGTLTPLVSLTLMFLGN